MKNLVLFLGAGSSKAFGLPLTNEIFPLILERLSKYQLFKNNKNECEHLSNFLYKLMPGIKTNKNLPSITDILSLIDYLILHINIPWPMIDNKNLSYYRILIERAIFEVLDLPYNDKIEYEVPLLLKNFVSWIFSQMKEKDISIISTNYDLTVELELFRQIQNTKLIETKVDFGFSWRVPFVESIQHSPQEPIFKLFKLHGSLNWLKCELCENIYINLKGRIYHQAFRNKLDDNNTCICGHGPLKSVIIAPSIERDIRDVSIVNIWRNSLEALRTADEWIIIGYSLPIEDLTIRSMLLRAYHCERQKPSIIVVQKGSVAKEQYSLFFDDFKYFEDGLESFIRGQLLNIP